MKKLGLLMFAGLIACSVSGAMAIGETSFSSFNPSSMMQIQQDAGALSSHDMQIINQQRREFEESINYKKQKRQQEANQQVQETFSQFKNGSDSTVGKQLQFMRNDDGSIIIQEAK